MRKLHHFGVISIALLLFSSELHSQCPGSSMSWPIYIGTLGPGSSYSDRKNNGDANCFSNQIGQPSSDVFYQFYLSTTAQVNISHCGSGFDTYLHLLDQNGTEIAYDDDNGPLCSGLTASISQTLSPERIMSYQRDTAAIPVILIRK